MIRAADIMRERLGTLRPETAIILGSSLGPVADAVAAPVRIPYRGLAGLSGAEDLRPCGRSLCRHIWAARLSWSCAGAAILMRRAMPR